jgi:hypothetical protein
MPTSPAIVVPIDARVWLACFIVSLAGCVHELVRRLSWLIDDLRPVAARAITDAFGLLGLTSTEAEAYSHIGAIRSLQDAQNDLNAHADVSMSDANVQTVTQHARYQPRIVASTTA